MTRRRMLGQFAAALLAQPAFAQRQAILAALPASTEVYQRALDQLRATMRKHDFDTNVVDASKMGSEAIRSSASGGIKLAIGFGTKMSEALLSPPCGVPVIAAFLSQQSEGSLSRARCCIYVDLSLSLVAKGLHDLFPGKTLGVIVNPAQTAVSTRLEAEVKASPVPVKVARCSAPDNLLNAVKSLAGQADFIWCLPDSSLYNASTLEGLVRASISLRVPLVGFSESFVRSGAAVGIYPDFEDAGRLVGECAETILQGRALPPDIRLRKATVAINPRVLRLMQVPQPRATKAGMVVIE